MTVDVAEARTLAATAKKAAEANKQVLVCRFSYANHVSFKIMVKLFMKVFMVNNTANFREKCFDARRLVEAGELGKISHVLCVMYSPLMFLFDDPANTGWVKPSGSMTQPDGSGTLQI